MDPANWIIVIALNGGIILYGILRGRDTNTRSTGF